MLWVGSNKMSYGVSQTRSIGDIVEALKTSFRSTDYSAAISELTAREDGLRREKGEIVARLREKCDSLKAACAGLKTNVVLLTEERRRLRRDCDVNDDKLNDLARDLSLLKEKEEKANKRYGCLLNDVRVMEEDKITLIEEKAGLRDNLEELKRSLSEKEVMIEDFKSREAQINAKLGELEELRRTNARLLEEKLKHDAHLEEVTREKDERIEELNKLEDAKKLLEAEHKALRENLEEQKAKVGVQEEERRRNNLEKDEQIRKLERENNEVVKEKDGKIQDLIMDIESSNLEKRRLTEKLELVNKRFSKLEEDVITCMFLDVERDKRFASTFIGKIISGIIQAIDSEEIGHTCNAGVKKDRNAQEADSTSNSCVNESICRLKCGKPSAEDVKRTLDFKSESPREDGAIGSKKSIIVIEDNDDEDEIPRYASGADNKRKCLGTMNDQHNNEGSNDDNLNPKHKIMKVEHLHCEHVMQESSPAALSVAKDGYKFSSQRQTPATIKRCVETLSREVGGLSSLQGDNDRKGNESKYKDGTPKADELCSPQTKDYMSNIRQKRQNKRLECPADMLLAFDKDDDFCTKAVCALYRQHNRSSGNIGSDIGGSTRFEESDWERVKNLAEFLSDGDPSGKPKKSVVELQGHDPKGLVDCRHFARKYCKGLIGIYKKKVDPLFSPSSIDLQYT